MTIQQAFDLARQHHEAGRIPQAQQLYRQVLTRQPNHADAQYFLGILAHQVGRNDIAADLLRQAITLRPNWPQAYFALGEVMRALGQLNEAIAAYRKAIALKGDYPEACNNLGNCLQANGQLDEAVTSYRQAIALRSDYPRAHNNLGNVLSDMKRLDESAAAYRRAIALKPDYAEAHGNLGNVLHAMGRVDEAIAAYRQAITIRPGHTEALCNLGNVLFAIGQVDEAVAAYRQAIALRPDHTEALSNLGNVMQSKGQLDEAIGLYRQAIRLKPDHAEAHSNLGCALKGKGQLDEAIAACRQAIALKPELPSAHSNLGNVLKEKGRLDEAIAAYRQAIALQPDFPEALSSLGNALWGKGQLDEALVVLQKAVALNPKLADAFVNLGTVLRRKGLLGDALAAFREATKLQPANVEAQNDLGNALKDSGRLDEAIATYRQAVAQRPDYLAAHSNLVYTLYFHPAYDARAIAAEHRDWAMRHAEPLKPFIKAHPNDRDPDRRLRIGYISPDFRQHPVGRFLLPLLAHHDHRSFEVFAYAIAPEHGAVVDAMTEHLRGHTDAWRPIGELSDAEAVYLIREDRIDILVDLTLHMADNRLLIFARKPAPVQVTYLAYAGTSGLSTMDYRLSDPWLDPPSGDESIYTEKTIRLPETYWRYLPAQFPERPPPTLETGFITFGSMNNFCKVNDPLLTLWSRLLAAVPHSRLVLHAQYGSHRQSVLDYLQRHGVEPHRVSFVGTLLGKAYFESYHSIDIALDTAPYGGGTTTCDALWMGVPVVSLAGKTAVGRGGLSILSNIGVPELVAHTPEEYVRIAANLANDVTRLKELRSTLRERMQASPLMDAPKFARGVEAAYRQMWRSWCAAQ